MSTLLSARCHDGAGPGSTKSLIGPVCRGRTCSSGRIPLRALRARDISSEDPANQRRPATTVPSLRRLQRDATALRRKRVYRLSYPLEIIVADHVRDVLGHIRDNNPISGRKEERMMVPVPHTVSRMISAADHPEIASLSAITIFLTVSNAPAAPSDAPAAAATSPDAMAPARTGRRPTRHRPLSSVGYILLDGLG